MTRLPPPPPSPAPRRRGPVVAVLDPLPPGRQGRGGNELHPGYGAGEPDDHGLDDHGLVGGQRRQRRRQRLGLVVALVALIALVLATVTLPRAGKHRHLDVWPGPAPPNKPLVDGKAFSHQGELAFVSRGRLYLLQGRSGRLTAVPGPGQPSQPTWSSDGTWLAFLRSTGSSQRGGALWMVRADGRSAHQVGPVGVTAFSWSPVGEALTVVVAGSAGSRTALYLDGPTGPARLLMAPPGGVGPTGWSPAGTSLAVAGQAGGLWVLDTAPRAPAAGSGGRSVAGPSAGVHAPASTHAGSTASGPAARPASSHPAPGRSQAAPSAGGQAANPSSRVATQPAAATVSSASKAAAHHSRSTSTAPAAHATTSTAPAAHASLPPGTTATHPGSAGSGSDASQPPPGSTLAGAGPGDGTLTAPADPGVTAAALDWSPAGDALAVVTHRAGSTAIGTVSVSPAGRIGSLRVRARVAQGKATALGWWPDGQGLTWVQTAGQSYQLHLSPLGSGPSIGHSLAGPAGGAGAGTDGAESFAWAPDGSKLALVDAQGQPWICRPADGTCAPLAAPPGLAFATPAWSPDSSRLALVGHAGPTGTGGTAPSCGTDATAKGTLWVSRAGPGATLSCVPGAGTGVHSPAWAADGSQVAVVRDGAVWLVPPDAKGQARFVAGPVSVAGLDAGAGPWTGDGASLAWYRW
ncbi:MAG: hypothetical protein ACRD0J_11940 [Acidimicrobiales bacterium]